MIEKKKNHLGRSAILWLLQFLQQEIPASAEVVEAPKLRRVLPCSMLWLPLMAARESSFCPSSRESRKKKKLYKIFFAPFLVFIF